MSLSFVNCPNNTSLSSSLPNPTDLLQSVLFSSSVSNLSNPMLPYSTFSTIELETLRTKLNTAEQQIRSSKQQSGPLVVTFTVNEVYTLRKMLDVCSTPSMTGGGLLPATPTALGTGFASQFGALAPYLSSPPATILDDAAVASVKGMVSGMSSSNLSLSITPNTSSAVSSEKTAYRNHGSNMGGDNSSSTGGKSSAGRSSRSGREGRRVSSVPPPHYRCHRCGDPGHWLEDCQRRRPDPTFTIEQQDAPPDSYVCHKCNVPGHWIFNCPLRKVDPDAPKAPPKHYICHKCGIPGHWIHDCPETIKEQMEKHGHSHVHGSGMDLGMISGLAATPSSLRYPSAMAPAFSPGSIVPRTVGSLKNNVSGSSNSSLMSSSVEASSPMVSPVTPSKSTKST